MEGCCLLALIASCILNTALAQNQECLAVPQRRPCESHDDKERRFFNSTSGTCESFDWRTCTTGTNSFSGWEECRHACVCQLPPEPTTCDPSLGYMSFGRYFFNKDTNICEPFPEGSGDCSRNGNAFRSESACKMTCVCSMPADPGSGDDQGSAFVFNSDSHRCEEITYTGEGGNANRFDTEEQCKEQCLCGMPRAPADNEATCFAYMPSYFYNGATNQCERFIYGGCWGNNNRFGTLTECDEACT